MSGFLTVVLYTQRIIQSFIVAQFPIRGAIAFGETYLDNNASIFLGNGYLNAVELEKKQEWIGVSIDKSVEKKFPNYFSPNNLITKIDLLNGKQTEIYSNPSIIIVLQISLLALSAR